MHRNILLAMIMTIPFCLTASAQAADEEPLPVFLLAGQSNMEGCAIVADLPEEKRQKQEQVLFFDKDQWLPLEPGTVPEGKRFGPEVSFGQAMAKHLGKTVGLVKVASGGTDLAERWSPDGNKNVCYRNFIKKVKDAQKNRKIEIKGMIWMQGGADAKNEDSAKAYKDNLTRFIESLRKEFDAPGMPFVCGRSNPEATKFAYIQDVRTAQESVALPGYLWFDCDAITKGADNVHYNAAGQLVAGELFAKGMITLLDKK